MTEILQVWKCEICGNIVEVVHEGADALVCCGQPMNLQEEKIRDEGNEKHVPVIEGKIVKIGSVEHPMEEAHYIEWIEAIDGEKSSKVFLKPGDKPEAEFCFDVVGVKAYCNLHGLWKSE